MISHQHLVLNELKTTPMIQVGIRSEQRMCKHFFSRFDWLLAQIMDFGPPFLTKIMFFGHILDLKLGHLTPHMVTIGMKLLYGEAGILETHS